MLHAVSADTSFYCCYPCQNWHSKYDLTAAFPILAFVVVAAAVVVVAAAVVAVVVVDVVAVACNIYNMMSFAVVFFCCG